MKNHLLSAGLCFGMLVSVSAVAQKSNAKWKALYNGKNLAGWRTYQGKPADSWSVNDGMLYNKGNKDTNTRHADLITASQYENFELSLDWKIAKGGNSGILYMVTEEYPRSYESGPEYQLLDDIGYPAKIENWQKTGANYAMDPPMVDATKPAGEWNNTVIMVNKGRVEHWLNGKKVVQYELWTDTWKQHKAAGKWKDDKGYGASKKGHIAIQDHGGEAWFRNIKIRKL